MKKKIDFPYFEVVYDVIKRHRGKDAADGWAGIFTGNFGNHWGSHWYEALGQMLEECKTEADARAAVETLFYLGEHHEHVQNSIFNHYRGIQDPIFDDGEIIYTATRQYKEKKNRSKKSWLARLFG